MEPNPTNPITLSAEDVRVVAQLAKLDPTTDEIERYRHDLAAVLGYVSRLDPAALSGVEPLVHVGASVNRLDADVVGPMLPRSVVLGLAPETDGAFIKVPKVLGTGESA